MNGVIVGIDLELGIAARLVARRLGRVAVEREVRDEPSRIRSEAAMDDPAS
jgi:hypothetical protein